jgi:hypothetical protein
MATLKDAANLTGQLEELSGQLTQELSDGDADFARLTELAGELRERADSLASTFAAVDEALTNNAQALSKG